MSGTGEKRAPIATDADAAAQRLDKWLWFARITKSRTLAAQLVVDGKVRVNRTKAAKASQTVRSGDVLTIALRGHVQVLRVLAPGLRRGPPPEARQLYEVVSSVGGGGVHRPPDLVPDAPQSATVGSPTGSRKRTGERPIFGR